MLGLTVKKLLPAFIPIVWEVAHHMQRNMAHNNNIKKIDPNEEKLATIENLLVRLEKKSLGNREELRASTIRLQIWLGINSALLIAIAVKVFFL